MTLTRITGSRIEDLGPKDEPLAEQSEPLLPTPTGDASPLTLGAALEAEEIYTNQPYAFKDEVGRLFSINNPAVCPWTWANYVPYESYAQLVVPLIPQGSPSTGPFTLSALTNGTLLPLTATNTADDCEAIWGQQNPTQKPVTLTLEVAQTFPPPRTPVYQLRRSATSCLSGGFSNPTDWAVFQSKPRYLFFSLHRFFVERGKLLQLLGQAWPGQEIYFKDYSTLRLADRGYEVLTDALATALWNSSELNPECWTPESFDCDDFSYVYKAQASRYALAQKEPSSGCKSTMKRSLAVGIVFGVAKDGKSAHAANLYVNYEGKLKIIDYGKIVDAAAWDFVPNFVLM
jgi:hypothetical protein